MIVNIINSYRDVIAICDSELLGKTFEEQIEGSKEIRQLHVKENFYKGDKGKKYSEQELLNLIKSLSREDSTFNIVGKKSIKVALKSGIITEKSVARIKGIPYTLVLL